MIDLASASRFFDLPEFAYFSSGNDFTGSLNGFRFRILPQDGQLQVYQYSDTSFALADVHAEGVFPLTADGLAEAILWVEAAYEAHAPTPYDNAKGHLKASQLAAGPQE